MTGPFIFIATNRLKPGAYEAERHRVPGLVEFLKASEPRLLALNEYINAERTEVTVVQVHPDAQSMELHMSVVRERAAQAYAATLDATAQIQVSGPRAARWCRRCARRPAPECRSASTPTTSEDSRGSATDAAALGADSTAALDDVRASSAPEVTLVLSPGDARVSRGVDNTLGARPLRKHEQAPASPKSGRRLRGGTSPRPAPPR